MRLSVIWLRIFLICRPVQSMRRSRYYVVVSRDRMRRASNFCYRQPGRQLILADCCCWICFIFIFGHWRRHITFISFFLAIGSIFRNTSSFRPSFFPNWTSSPLFCFPGSWVYHGAFGTLLLNDYLWIQVWYFRFGVFATYVELSRGGWDCEECWC
jgi:hypothetical protein